MKPTRWLALSAAFAGSAVACAIYVLRQADSGKGSAAALAEIKSRADESRRPSFRPEVMEPRADRQSGRAESDGGPLAEPRRVFGTPLAGAGPVHSELEWRAHAEAVARDANHELKRLTDLLDLDTNQQDQVFSALARQSSSWMPGMQTGGDLANTAGEASSDLTAYLSADQQQTLIQEEMDRQAWWEEVLPQLLPPEMTDAAAAPDSTGEAPPATKEFEGDGMLLE